MNFGDGFFFLVVVACFVISLVRIGDSGRARITASRWPIVIGTSLLVSWVVAILVGGFMYVLDLPRDDYELSPAPIYSREAAKDLYGFENEVEYPLLLRKETSVDLSTESRSGFFSSFARSDGGQTVTVEYLANDGNSYWINIPTSVIAWDKTGTTDQPTISVEFSSTTQFGQETEYDVDGCKTQWRYLRLQCVREYEKVSVSYLDDYTLPEIIEGNITNVTIKISEEDYQEFFNGL